RTFQIKLGDAVMQSLIYISMFFICLELQSVLESLLIQFAAHQLAAHTPIKKIIIIDPEKKRTFFMRKNKGLFFLGSEDIQHKARRDTFYFKIEKHDLYCNFVFLFILSHHGGGGGGGGGPPAYFYKNLFIDF
ncbi:hypothetical protein ACJX0J_042194, partial [Zea mays]